MNTTKLEKEIYFNCNVLIKGKDTITAITLDEELDPIELIFNYDECVEINTADLEYIVFSKRHLKNIIKLIEQSEHFGH